MNTLDFLSNVLQDYCNLHDLPFISADDLLYESNTQELDCYTKLTSEQEDWLSCYIKVWDLAAANEQQLKPLKCPYSVPIFKTL